MLAEKSVGADTKFMQNIMMKRFATLAVILVSVFGSLNIAMAAPGAPSNLSIVGGKYTNDTTPTFTWTPGSGATWYEVLLDDGEWISVGNISSYTLWSLPNGWHTFYVRSHDNVNGVSVSEGLTFEIDTVGPTIPAPTPSLATVNVPTVFSVIPTGESIATYCWMYVDGNAVGQLAAVGASSAEHPILGRSYTFTTSGNHTMYARCLDRDGNYSNGSVRTVVVSKNTAPIPYGEDGISGNTVAKGTVIIAKCSKNAPSGDACHTVYYYGEDGKKHAFPSESVYFTWYSSYANMKTVSQSYVNALPTGGAVTYRPGSVLVKFTGSTTVYAVADGQVLRPIMNEAAAKSIYGSNWNASVVTISSSYKSNYNIGAKIYSSADYSKTKEYWGTTTIDQNWK